MFNLNFQKVICFASLIQLGNLYSDQPADSFLHYFTLRGQIRSRSCHNLLVQNGMQAPDEEFFVYCVLLLIRYDPRNVSYLLLYAAAAPKCVAIRKTVASTGMCTQVYFHFAHPPRKCEKEMEACCYAPGGFLAFVPCNVSPGGLTISL